MPTTLDEPHRARHHRWMLLRFVLAWLFVVAGVGCSDPPIDPPVDPGEENPDDDLDGVDSTTRLSDDVFPCDELAAWPYSVASTKHPLRVHFRARDEEAVARTLSGHLDEAWDVQVTTLGMPAPFTDEFDASNFFCGDDGRIDVFMLKGLEGAYVDIVASIESTPIDDYAAFMVIDPFGLYGGDYLRPTAFHEFHHLTQAALDWNDTTNVYEMSATFVEEVMADDRDWEFTLVDLVDNVGWSIDRDDGYETNFMYAQALYLIFLQHHYFDGDVDFFVQMWRGLVGEPDYQDALDVLLAPHGVDFIGTVPLYARWLAYLGEHDDGRHFPRGADYPAIARQLVVDGDVTVSPMVLGSAYLETSAASSVSLVGTVPADHAVVVQLASSSASSDGAVLALPAAVPAGATLVVTVVPTGPSSIALRTEAPVDVTLRFSSR